jgi:septal ring factor EnvC (AmiA/AmiB activator)
MKPTVLLTHSLFGLAAVVLIGALIGVPTGERIAHPPVEVLLFLVLGGGVACFFTLALAFAPAKRRNDQPSVAAAERKTREAKPNDISNTTTETELAKARETIVRLRETGKRAVAQSERWEATAKALEKELADLRRQNGKSDDRKFEEAKRAFAKLYHPNASSSRSPLETMVRSEIFKEFWTELERIEVKT